MAEASPPANKSGILRNPAELTGKQSSQHVKKLVQSSELKEILATRLTSISIGAFVYLLIDERDNIYNSAAKATDIIDWLRIVLFISYVFSLASIGQLLWDLFILLLEMIVSWIPFGKATTGFKFYTNLYGSLQGCSALYGYFLSVHGCELWKTLEAKSNCFIRMKGSSHEGNSCEYEILSLTLELEKLVCGVASPVCSKVVFFFPFLTIGGVVTLIGGLVAVEYLISNDFELPYSDSKSSGETDDEYETE